LFGHSITLKSTTNQKKPKTMEDKIKKLSQAALDKWTPLAAEAEEATLTAPLHSVLGEAADVATLFDHHWQEQPHRSGKPLPGFSGVAVNSLLSEDTGAEVRELQLAITAAHSDYLVLVQSSQAAPMDRAEFLLQELRSTLAYLFDDGQHDDADEQLASVEKALPGSGSQDAMALGLDSFAGLADRYRKELGKVAGFDLDLIAEARTLADALRQRSAQQLAQGNLNEQRATLALRNRLLSCLLERVGNVRRAAQYLFRAHPEISRRFTSTHERKQRSARRRKAEAATSAAE
jgi:hypothetical protein